MTVQIPSVSNQFIDKGSGLGPGNPKAFSYVLGVATGAAALLSAVTATGTTPPTVTVSGYPKGDYKIHIDIDGGGALATATFRWSIDDGVSWVATTVATAASVALGNTGVTVAFSAGTYNADNLYTFTANQIPIKTYSSPEKLKTDYTGGKGVECAVAILTAAGSSGAKVRFVPVPASVAGSNSSVTASNGSAPAVTLSGTPNDDYQGEVEILSTGARGTATFRYRLGKDENWSAPIATAATYAIAGSGLTLNFASGTYTDGDTYVWESTSPSYATADLAAAFDAIKRKGLRGKIAFIVGEASGASDSAKATACASVFSSVSTKLAELATAKLYMAAAMSAPFVTDTAALATGMASATDTDMVVCADWVQFTSSVNQRSVKRSSMFPAAQIISRIDLSQDAAQKTGVCALPSNTTALGRDEGRDPALNDERFLTLRTWEDDQTAFYITNPVTRASNGSDLDLLQNVFVKHRILEALDAYWARVCSLKLRVNTDGTLTAATASGLEAGCRDAVLKYLGADLVDFQCTVDRAQDVKTSKEILYDFVAQNYAYAKKITGKGSFANALTTL